MATVELGEDGRFHFELSSSDEVAALRVALKAMDGPDEIEPAIGVPLSLEFENPFNSFAIWLAGFDLSLAACRAMLDTIAPLATTHLHVHSRSFQKLSMRRMRDMQSHEPPAKERDGQE